MHTYTKQILTLYITMTCGLFLSQSILDDFAIDLNQGKVLLAWTIKSGNVCNGIQIYRNIVGPSRKPIKIYRNIVGLS